MNIQLLDKKFDYKFENLPQNYLIDENCSLKSTKNARNILKEKYEKHKFENYNILTLLQKCTTEFGAKNPPLNKNIWKLLLTHISLNKHLDENNSNNNDDDNNNKEIQEKK